MPNWGPICFPQELEKTTLEELLCLKYWNLVVAVAVMLDHLNY